MGSGNAQDMQRLQKKLCVLQRDLLNSVHSEVFIMWPNVAYIPTFKTDTGTSFLLNWMFYLHSMGGLEFLDKTIV